MKALEKRITGNKEQSFSVLFLFLNSQRKRIHCREIPPEDWRSLARCSFEVNLIALIENLPVMQETPVQSLDWEDPLEKGKATHSSILSWRISKRTLEG